MELREDRLYTAEELAVLLGVSVRSLQRAVARGDVKARKLGRKLLFVGRDVLYGLPVRSLRSDSERSASLFVGRDVLYGLPVAPGGDVVNESGCLSE